MEKGILTTPEKDETEGFGCLGHSNWTICSLLSHFCSHIFAPYSLSYWEASSYYPRGPITGKGDSSNLIKGKDKKVCPAQFQSRHIATKGASGATFGEISVQELRAIIIWHWKASPWRCSSECGRAEERTRTLADTLKGIRKRSEVTKAKMVSFRF